MFPVSPGDQVWVEWDADGHRNIYCYGQGGFDLLLVDEPRVLNPGQAMAVGCLVKPGQSIRGFILSSILLSYLVSFSKKNILTHAYNVCSIVLVGLIFFILVLTEDISSFFVYFFFINKTIELFKKG